MIYRTVMKSRVFAVLALAAATLAIAAPAHAHGGGPDACNPATQPPLLTRTHTPGVDVIDTLVVHAHVGCRPSLLGSAWVTTPGWTAEWKTFGASRDCKIFARHKPPAKAWRPWREVAYISPCSSAPPTVPGS